MKAKVYHLVYKSLKLDFVLSQLNPVHALYIYILSITYNITHTHYIYLHILITMLLDRQHGHKRF